MIIHTNMFNLQLNQIHFVMFIEKNKIIKNFWNSMDKNIFLDNVSFLLYILLVFNCWDYLYVIYVNLSKSLICTMTMTLYYYICKFYIHFFGIY